MQLNLARIIWKLKHIRLGIMWETPLIHKGESMSAVTCLGSLFVFLLYLL